MSEMTCRDTVAALMDYVDGRTPRARRRSLEAHLASCPPCRAFLDSYRATPLIVRRQTDARLPTALARRLAGRLRGASRRR